MGIGKAISVLVLGIFSVATTVSGLWFAGYSLNTDNYVLVFGNKIPGFLFGMVVVYLGVRSLLKVYRLQNKIKQPDIVFSWRNFVRK